jgi:hypothetical protein
MPSELVIVNLRAMSLCHPNLSLDALERESQTDYAQLLADLSSNQSIHLYRTPEERKQVIVKYVTMEEYLSYYNWKGEFTEEQVAPWLRSVRAMKRRKRSQISEKDDPHKKQKA